MGLFSFLGASYKLTVEGAKVTGSALRSVGRELETLNKELSEYNQKLNTLEPLTNIKHCARINAITAKGLEIGLDAHYTKTAALLNRTAQLYEGVAEFLDELLLNDERALNFASQRDNMQWLVPFSTFIDTVDKKQNNTVPTSWNGITKQQELLMSFEDNEGQSHALDSPDLRVLFFGQCNFENAMSWIDRAEHELLSLKSSLIQQK